jgi:hypothetical protein
VTPVLGLLAVLGFACAQAAPSEQANVLGKTYGEWQAEWWQWVSSIPAGENPILQSGAVNCRLGQRGAVWFLAGTFGGDPVVRSCTIPAGKAIFFPLVNTIILDLPPPDAPFTVAEKRQAADAALSLACNLSAELDGTPTVYSVVTGRTQSPPFFALAGLDDIFGRDPGTLDPAAVSDGYWIMLSPLPPGEHTLRFTGALCDPSGTPFFSTDATYTLTIMGFLDGREE